MQRFMISADFLPSICLVLLTFLVFTPNEVKSLKGIFSKHDQSISFPICREEGRPSSLQTSLCRFPKFLKEKIEIKSRNFSQKNKNNQQAHPRYAFVGKNTNTHQHHQKATKVTMISGEAESEENISKGENDNEYQNKKTARKKLSKPYLRLLKRTRAGGDGETISVSLSTIDLLICGGLATAAGDLALHPIDTIKTIQQASSVSMSMLGACKNIVKDLGPFGFYAGVAPYVTMDGLAGSIKFATYEAAKKLINPILPVAMIPYSHFLCAATAFMSCSVVLVPGELLKQRLQAGMAKTLAGGMKQIWVTEGLKGFFTGYKATLIRDVPYTMLELGLYENFKSLIRWHHKKETLTTQEELLAAAVTGGIVGLLTNPLDLVKTRLMTASSTQYKGVFDVITQMYQKEGGMSVFMNGAQARVLWLLPFTFIQFGVYEATKRGMLKMKNVKPTKD